MKASFGALLLALAGAVAAAPSYAGADCKDESVCITALEEGDKVRVRARNLKAFPVTYTLRVRASNYDIDGPATVTRTLAPLQSEEIMQLTPEGGGNKSQYRLYFEWTVGDKDAEHDDDHVYSLPYAPGRSYRVLQGYGSRFSHKGLEEFAVDFDMPEGTPVHAARGGIVARVEESNTRGCWEDGCGRYANYVVVLHNDGTTGEYYHLKEGGALVNVGDSVAQGQMIGLSGNTGHTTMPHLHFAVYRAAVWGNTQSIPVRFQADSGIVYRPRRGARYLAIR
ncbi:MAG: M23 family metallopeptidase [Woeseiaceae bacterium]|jgi:murein DD-endopeptidase MepM/ murein hydrolase activator NlpD|nr:M23 family metallopeptidase [Woeseiaceae bacterium]